MIELTIIPSGSPWYDATRVTPGTYWQFGDRTRRVVAAWTRLSDRKLIVFVT